MVTIMGMSPLSIGPDFVIRLETITVMSAGTVAGGCELLPGSLCHVPPQVDGFGFGEVAKPLKLAVGPPLLK
jgi:hypothetical protein